MTGVWHLISQGPVVAYHCPDNLAPQTLLVFKHVFLHGATAHVLKHVF
jgi:hypothetical protein